MSRGKRLGALLAPVFAAGVLGLYAHGVCASDVPLLETIAAQLDTAPVIVAEFTQTRRISGLKQPVVSSGRVVFARGQGLVWQIERPFRHAYVFSAQGLTEIDAKGERRPRASGQAGDVAQGARVFDALLRGDLTALREHFEVEVQGAREAWTAQLRPRRAEVASALRSLTLKGGREVQEIALTEASGDLSHIALRVARRGDALAPAEARLFGP